MQDNPSVSRSVESQFADRESAKNYIRTTRASSLCTCHCDQTGICAKRCPSFSNQRINTSQFITAPQIRDVVSKMEQTGWFPAISKSEMSAYYEFELVKSAEITSQGLHIELEIPFHHTYAKYQVYWTVAIPQPLNSGKTATVDDFQKEYFVISQRQEFFGELDRSE